jgi:hypothetical protein
MHAAPMFSRVRHHFKDARFARMSDGTICVIRDLGLVKGGKGMRHHEVVMTMSFKALSRQIRTRSLSWMRSLMQRARLSNAQHTAVNDAPNEMPATKS